MQFLHSLIFGTLLATLANAAPGTKSRLPVHSPSYYSCAGLPDGNYQNPYDCTRYINCSNGRATDMPCGDCNSEENVNGCQENDFLFYNPDIGECDYPEDTECVEDTKPDAPADNTTTGGVLHPPSECSEIKEGHPCEIGCDQCDWCHHLTSYYFHCVKHSSHNPFAPAKYKKEKCDKGYLIDKRKPLADGVKGGQCTAWDDLHPESKEEYLKDKKCIPDKDETCEWGQDPLDHCTGRYWYKEGPGKPKEHKQCSGSGIWDPKKNNCRDCWEVEICLAFCLIEEVVTELPLPLP